MKKFAVFIVLILSCFMFVGCGQRLPSSNEFILLSVENKASGQIVQSLNFSLGSEKLKENGVKAEDVEKVKAKLTKNIETFHAEFYLNFALVYNENPKEEYQLGKGLIFTDVAYNKQADSIGFSMTFTSNEAWKYYHESNGESSGNEFEYGFMITTTSTGEFPFSANIETSSGQITVGQRYMNAYLDALNFANVTLKYTPDLVYDYATAESRIKSDSEYYFADGELYHHVWLRSSETYKENNKITLRVVQANRGVWYVLILGVTLLGVGIAVTIIKLKDKKQSK